MDKHLNLFYSYSQGNRKNTEKFKQLEDNITRALMITIKNLDFDLQKEIFEIMTDEKPVSKEFKFDLQNTSKDTAKSKKKKLVVIIQNSTGNEITERIKEFNHDIKEFENLLQENKQENKKEKLAKVIKKAISSDSYDGIISFEGHDFEIPLNELNSFYQLVHGSRPDAWMIGDKEIILFEVKIDNNKVSPYQLHRHITDKNGFKSNIDEVEIKFITWPGLCNMFKKLSDKTNNIHSKKIICELIQYLTMTAQNLNFDYIIKTDGLNTENHRAMFNHFLNEFDEKLKNIEELKEFKRKNRSKTGLWEPYGLSEEKSKGAKPYAKHNKNGILENPHYTISFRDDSIGIYLTTRTITQLDKLFMEKFKNFLNEKMTNITNDSSSKKYYFDIRKSKMVDRLPGQVRGESQNTFNFNFRFSDINEKNIDEMSEIILKFTKNKMYKQMDLGLIIDFYDFSKIREDDQKNSRQIRKENLQLLENPYKIIDLFLNFMKETLHLYYELAKKKLVKE